jgi:hypothetical protein
MLQNDAIYSGLFVILVHFAQAWKEVVRNWHILFEISRYNHRNGVQYWSFLRGWKYLRSAHRHFKILQKLENELQVS